MLTMRKEFILTMKDLRFVRITCQACGVQVTLDLANFQKNLRRNTFTPRTCPACGMDFDRTTQHLDAIQERYQALTDLGVHVAFCVQVEEGQTS